MNCLSPEVRSKPEATFWMSTAYRLLEDIDSIATYLAQNYGKPPAK